MMTRADLDAPITAEAFGRRPSPPAGQREELLEGEVVLTPAPTPRHQRVLRNLFRTLDVHVTARALGELLFAPTDVLLDETNVLQPDLLFVPAERAAIVGAKQVEGPPQLVVEVLSPSTRDVDRGLKLTIYQRHGVAHYWVLDPDERLLEELVLGSSGFVVRSRRRGAVRFSPLVFPGLELDLAEVWA